MKEHEKLKKKQAITDLNVPNGSRDIPFKVRNLNNMDVAIL